MALTRKLLKGMGLTDEQVDTIIEAHGDTVDGLKNDIQRYKADADKLPGIQKELDDLKKDNGDDFKARYEKEHKEFQDYKDGIAKKEAAAAKEKAARAYFESKGIPAKSMGLVIRGAKGEIESLELDGEKIKDASALDSLLDGDYKGLIGKVKESGTNTQNPPETSGSKMTKEQIMAIKDTAQRQKAMYDNAELFGIG
nr:MAG TPA: minor structural protein [Caudoviricetes sp.]